jgi:hypothetical protein
VCRDFRKVPFRVIAAAVAEKPTDHVRRDLACALRVKRLSGNETQDRDRRPPVQQPRPFAAEHKQGGRYSGRPFKVESAPAAA